MREGGYFEREAPLCWRFGIVKSYKGQGVGAVCGGNLQNLKCITKCPQRITLPQLDSCHFPKLYTRCPVGCGGFLMSLLRSGLASATRKPRAVRNESAQEREPGGGGGERGRGRGLTQGSQLWVSHSSCCFGQAAPSLPCRGLSVDLKQFGWSLPPLPRPHPPAHLVKEGTPPVGGPPAAPHAA